MAMGDKENSCPPVQQHETDDMDEALSPETAAHEEPNEPETASENRIDRFALLLATVDDDEDGRDPPPPCDAAAAQDQAPDGPLSSSPSLSENRFNRFALPSAAEDSDGRDPPPASETAFVLKLFDPKSDIFVGQNGTLCFGTSSSTATTANASSKEVDSEQTPPVTALSGLLAASPHPTKAQVVPSLSLSLGVESSVQEKRPSLRENASGRTELPIPRASFSGLFRRAAVESERKVSGMLEAATSPKPHTPPSFCHGLFGSLGEACTRGLFGKHLNAIGPPPPSRSDDIKPTNPAAVASASWLLLEDPHVESIGLKVVDENAADGGRKKDGLLAAATPMFGYPVLGENAGDGWIAIESEPIDDSDIATNSGESLDGASSGSDVVLGESAQPATSSTQETSHRSSPSRRRWLPESDIWQPKVSYPLWDNQWDATGSETASGRLRHIFLIRHGEYHKWSEPDQQTLTERGREQAEMTGKRLAHLSMHLQQKRQSGLKVIRSSAMVRARETAEIIAKYLPDVERAPVDPLLNETKPARPIPHHPGAPGMIDTRPEEAFQKYFRRITLEDGDQDDGKDQYEVIVGHGNVIRYFFLRALQLPPEAWLRLTVSHCSLTHLAVYPDGDCACFRLGDNGHMQWKDNTCR